jgi:hypothetical protein
MSTSNARSEADFLRVGDHVMNYKIADTYMVMHVHGDQNVRICRVPRALICHSGGWPVALISGRPLARASPVHSEVIEPFRPNSLRRSQIGKCLLRRVATARSVLFSAPLVPAMFQSRHVADAGLTAAPTPTT